MSAYLPGQGVRFTTDVYQLGVLSDASSIVFTVQYADASNATPTVVHDGPGLYHSDLLIPNKPGVAVYKWVTSGAAPLNDSVAEGSFTVSALSF